MKDTKNIARWIDSLPLEWAETIDENERIPLALAHLADSAYLTDSQPFTSRSQASHAAALIVVERRRLHPESEKRLVAPSVASIHSAISCLAVYLREGRNPWGLRYAEAHLRGLWKQGQR